MSNACLLLLKRWPRLEPKRVLNLLNKFCVPGQFVCRCGVWAGGAIDFRYLNAANVHSGHRFIRKNIVGEAKADLPTASQLNIQLRQQLGIEQRAVLDAVAPVNSIAGAQGVQ